MLIHTVLRDADDSHVVNARSAREIVFREIKGGRAIRVTQLDCGAVEVHEDGARLVVLENPTAYTLAALNALANPDQLFPLVHYCDKPTRLNAMRNALGRAVDSFALCPRLVSELLKIKLLSDRDAMVYRPLAGSPDIRVNLKRVSNAAP